MLLLKTSGKKRTEFMKRHKLFGSIGENYLINKNKLPLYSNLIHIYDNVRIVSNVDFVTQYAGVPARFICTFDEHVEKVREYFGDFKKKYDILKPASIGDELAARIYENFKKERE